MRFSFSAIGFGVIAAALIVAGPAWPQEHQWEPPGFAEAQRGALWEVVKRDPRTARVQQMTILGNGATPVVDGSFWIWNARAQAFDVRLFSARFDRVCVEVVPRCFRVLELVSRGEVLIAVASKSHRPAN